MVTYTIYAIFIIVLLMATLFISMFICSRWLIKQIVQKTAKILLSDSYQENVLELLPGIKHLGLQATLENSLRASSGDLLHRPLGSSKAWPNFDSLTFIPAQTSPFPISGDEQVDLSVEIGPSSKQPLRLQIPMMISGMAYGIALSEQARISLATAAKKLDIAINSGEGGVLEEELNIGANYILQFSKTAWSKDEKLFKRANMVEIKLGQGALMGMGTKISPDNLTGKAREVMGLGEGETAVIYEHFFENQTLEQLKELVDQLREKTDGVPIGVKMAAGGKIEEDIDHLLELGVDYIAIDGGQAATMGAPPILSDDFGIPTFHAIVRADHHLKKRKKRECVSLVASGGLVVPGHFLKALALGADAIYIGSAMLFSVAHGQSIKALPFEPPTQIIWNEGKFKEQFDIEKGADAAEKFLVSAVEEMKIALRAMGKRSLVQLSIDDLVSYDEHIAKRLNIPYTFDPWKKRRK